MGNFCSMGASRQAKKEAMEDGGIYEKKKPEEPTQDAAQTDSTKPSIVVSDEHTSKPAEESIGFLSGATQLISDTGDQLKDMAEKEIDEKKKDIEVKAEETKQTVAAKTEEVKEAVVSKAEEIGQSISGTVAGFKSSADEKVKEAEEAKKGADDSLVDAVESAKGKTSELQTGISDNAKGIAESITAQEKEISAGISGAVTDVEKTVESTKDAAEAKMAATADAAKAEVIAAKESAESKMTAAKEEVETGAKQAAQTVNENVESAKQTAESTVASAKDEIETGVVSAKASAESQAVAVKEDVEKTIHETADEVSNKVESLKEETVAKKDEIAADITATAAQVTADVDSAKTAAVNEFESKKQSAEVGISSAVTDVETAAESAKDTVLSEVDEAQEEFGRMKQETEAHVSSAVDSASSTVDSAKEAAVSAKDTVVTGVTTVKQQVDTEITEVKDSAEKRGQEMKAEAVAAAVGLGENITTAKDAATEEVKSQIRTFEDNAKSAMESTADNVEAAGATQKEYVQQEFDTASSDARAVGGEIEAGLVQAATETSEAVVEKATSTGQEAQAAVQDTVQSTEDSLIGDFESGAKNVAAEGMDLLGEIDACRGGVTEMSKEIDDLLGSADESLTSGETQSDSLLGDVTPLTGSEVSQQTDSSIPTESDTITTPEVCVENRQEYANDVKPKQIAVTRNSDNTVTTKDIVSDSVATIPESPVADLTKPNLEYEGSSVDDSSSVDGPFSGFTETVKAGISDSAQKMTGLLDSAAGAIGGLIDTGDKSEEQANQNEAAPAATEPDDETVKRIAAEVTAQAVQQALEVVAAEEANNNIQNPEPAIPNPADLDDDSSSVDVLNSQGVEPSTAPNDTSIVSTPNQKRESAKSEVQAAETNSSVDPPLPPAPVNGSVEDATKDSAVDKKADCSDCSSSQKTEVQKEAMI